MSELVRIMEEAKASLRDHEGLRLEMYECPAGKQTIGYGHNCEDNGIPPIVQKALDAQGKITEKIAELVLEEDVRVCMYEIAQFNYWESTPASVKAALLDMYFCLGMNRYRKFKKMNAALADRDYERAADEILDSKFARQTGRRARYIADVVRAG